MSYLSLLFPADSAKDTRRSHKFEQFKKGYMKKASSVESKIQEELKDAEKRMFNEKADAIIQKQK